MNLFKLVGEITVSGMDYTINGLTTVDKKLNKTIKPLTRLGKQAEKTGGQLTKAFSLPILAAGGLITKFGADFEKSMDTSLAIMGDVSEDMRKTMEDTARDVVNYSTKSATAAADAYFYLASAGMSAEESIGALPKVTKFAQAGNFDLALATDLLTDAQSALGLVTDNTTESMENMTRVSDVLVKANTVANATVQQFSESLTNRAGAALRVVGKDIEEGVAVLAAYADQGRKGAEAGTMLDIVIRDLQKAAIKGKEVFEAAGVSVFDTSGEMRNMADIIYDLESLLASMSDEQKRATLTTLGFQEKSISATMALLGTSEKIREYEKDLRSAGGITEEVSQKQLKSLSSQFIMMKNRLLDVTITFSESLIPILKNDLLPIAEKIINKLKGWADGFNNLDSEQKKIIIKLVAFVAAAGPVLMIVSKIIGSITILTSVIRTAKLAMIAFNSVMLSNPLGLAITAVAGLTIAIIGLSNAYKKANKQLKEHREMIKETAESKHNAKLKGTLQELIYFYNQANESMYGTKDYKDAISAIDELETNLGDMGIAFDGGLLTKVDLAKEKLESLNTTVKESIESIDDNTESTTENSDVLQDTINKYSDFEQKIKNTLEAQKAQKAAEKEALKLSEDKADLIKNYQQRIEELIYTEVELIDIQRKRAVDEAKSLGANLQEIAAIESYYILFKAEKQEEAKNKAVNLAIQEYEAKKRLAKQEKDDAERNLKEIQDKRKDAFTQWKGFAEQSLSSIFTVFENFHKAKVMAIDNDLKKQIDAINQSTISEKQKQDKIAKIEEAADKKKKALQVKQAKRQKAQAMFNATVSAAQLAINGFMTQPFIPAGLIMGGIATALGAGIVASIAAQPLPELADGGLIRSRPGGVQAIIGEGSDDETVLPMKKGADEIAAGIMDRIKYSGSEVSLAGNISKPISNTTEIQKLRPIQNHLNIGTLIGDENGFKNLQRILYEYSIAEEKRKGAD